MWRFASKITAITTSAFQRVDCALRPFSVTTERIEEVRCSIAHALESCASVEESAHQALLEHDPTQRQNMNRYRARYLHFALEDLDKAIELYRSLLLDMARDRESPPTSAGPGERPSHADLPAAASRLASAFRGREGAMEPVAAAGAAPSSLPFQDKTASAQPTATCLGVSPLGSQDPVSSISGRVDGDGDGPAASQAAVLESGALATGLAQGYVEVMIRRQETRRALEKAEAASGAGAAGAGFGAG